MKAQDIDPNNSLRSGSCLHSMPTLERTESVSNACSKFSNSSFKWMKYRKKTIQKHKHKSGPGSYMYLFRHSFRVFAWDVLLD